MHVKFIRETTEKVDKEKTWQWLSRGDLKVGTEALLCAAPGTGNQDKLYIVPHRPVTTPRVVCVGKKVKVCNT